MKKEITKTKRVTIRLTEWEYAQLIKSMRITKQSATSFIVMAMLEKAQKIKGDR